jgi:6-pyruvoyltetrahydropterin/6-carboxytetrahydropterin synthase
MTIMRRIRFNAGHRLLGHEGRCAHFHGHNYLADFHVTGSETDAVGRIIDFAKLKAVLKGWIDENWDHSFLLSRDDENGIAAIRQVVPSRYFLLPDNPTAENMARYLLESVCPELLDPLHVTAWKVVLWETPESFAAATLPQFDRRFDAESDYASSADDYPSGLSW